VTARFTDALWLVAYCATILRGAVAKHGRIVSHSDDLRQRRALVFLSNIGYLRYLSAKSALVDLHIRAGIWPLGSIAGWIDEVPASGTVARDHLRGRMNLVIRVLACGLAVTTIAVSKQRRSVHAATAQPPTWS